MCGKMFLLISPWPHLCYTTFFKFGCYSLWYMFNLAFHSWKYNYLEGIVCFTYPHKPLCSYSKLLNTNPHPHQPWCLVADTLHRKLRYGIIARILNLTNFYVRFTIKDKDRAAYKDFSGDIWTSCNSWPEEICCLTPLTGFTQNGRKVWHSKSKLMKL